MNLCFLAVDDESLALSDLTEALRIAEPEADIHAFTDPEEARNAVCSGAIVPQIAFLDIQMRGQTGLDLAVELKKSLPTLEIIFVTAYGQYALESYSLHARGYLMKPVTPEDIEEELRNIGLATVPVQSPSQLTVQCFGNFEVFYGGKPLEFARAKSRELFAYLVFRRGAACSVKECAATLYEDREYDNALKNQIETFKSDLVRTLRTVGCEDVILRGRNRLSVDVSKFSCDYYQFLDGETSAISSFVGEFMSQYSWAEITTASLLGKMPKM
ncbi:MAG: response regulator [Oscillospiraceae bacterium]|nr:response regulator [Oscillospiraceae bacterium]